MLSFGLQEVILFWQVVNTDSFSYIFLNDIFVFIKGPHQSIAFSKAIPTDTCEMMRALTEKNLCVRKMQRILRDSVPHMSVVSFIEQGLWEELRLRSMSIHGR